VNWQQILSDAAQHGFAWGAALGATLGLGGGAGLITFLHYMPAPYTDQHWYGAVFDALQDRVKNMDRVGQRRERKATS
jgi:hypothetical protein